MKKCPYCAEEIQDEAIKCKHCGEFLDGSKPPTIPVQKLPWHFRTTPIVLTALSVPPFALPMIWWHPKFSLGWKIAISVVILILTWFAVFSMIAMFKTYNDIEKMLQGMQAGG